MPDALWRLIDVDDRLDEWIERESPNQDLIIAVTAWTLSRMEDPYESLRRDPGFANLWFGKVPRTYDPDTRTAIACTLFVDEQSHEVKIDRFARLGVPI